MRNKYNGGKPKQLKEFIMKRKSLLTLFAIITSFIIGNSVNAENFTYKVYNPKENKAYTVELGTVRLSDSGYIWCFYLKGGTPYAVVSLITDKKNNLVGGKCTDFNAFVKFLKNENIDLSKYEYGWREYNVGTFYRELEEIRAERAEQGYYEYSGK